MSKYVVPALVLILGVTAGCAVKDDTGSRTSPDVLTAQEIQSVPVASTYDVVRRLRPNWLRVRSAPTSGNPTPQRPIVYIDGVRAGTVGILRNIRRDNVIRIRFMDPTDATNRYGTGHTGGAILVTTG